MKNKKTLTFVVIGIIIVAIPFLYITIKPHYAEKRDFTSKNTESKETKIENFIKNEGTNFKSLALGPTISGLNKSMPWEKEENFIAAKQKNGTPVLVAGYCTVLKDPLPGEEYNVHLAASKLAGIIIKPGQVFSQNSQIGPYTESRGFRKGPTYSGSHVTTTIGGGVCKIASTVYNVAILSNLQIVERHAHGMPVPYVPYGQDATVAYGGKDIKFKNNTSSPILIWAKGIDNVLYMAFYSTEEAPKVEWHHERLKTYKAPSIFKTNPDLIPGTEKVVLEGMDGAVVRSWCTVQQKDGTVITRNLGNSSYSPLPNIIEKSK
jgi:vancomycin resistance protein VanW